MVNLSLTGLSASDRMPGNYVEINFGAGAASGAGAEKKALIIANKSSSGSAAVETLFGPDTVTPMTSEADAKALFGAGSPAHLMVKRFMEVNNSSPLYVMLVSSTGAAATGTFTISGTATASGSVRFWRDRNDFVDVSFASSDGYSTIVDALDDAINSKVNWDYTASAAASGVVTLTAKVPGSRGNQLRFKVQVMGNSTGISVSSSASTALTGGSGEDDYTNVCAAIVSSRFYYIIPESVDTSTLGVLKAQVASQALPITGIRQRIVSGSVEALATAITQATTLNYERQEIIHLAQSDWSAGQMAAHWVGNVMLQEAKMGSSGIALNQNGYGKTPESSGLWRVPAPLTNAKPTRSQLKSALNAGLTGIEVEDNLSTSVVKRVTTKTLTGSTVDYRTADAHIVSVADSFADQLVSKFALEFANKLASDDLDEDVPTPPGVVMPRQIKASTNQLIRTFYNIGLLREVNTIIAETIVSKNTDNVNRFGVIVPLRVQYISDSILARVDQV